MKVGINKEDLENEIYKGIYEINLMRNKKKNFIKRLISKGFLPGDAQQIASQNIAIDFMDTIDLGVIAESLFKTTNNPAIDPKLYFDDFELQKIKNFKLKIENENLTYPVEFNFMRQYADKMWVGAISLKKYVKLHSSRISTYNFQTQRNPLYKSYKQLEIKRPNINPKSVIEMKEQMLTNNYYYDDVTLNILDDGNDKFDFNKRIDNIGDIILYPGTILNVIDGAHRLKAAEAALLESPNLEANFILVITNFDIDRANNYIRQKDKRNPISKEYIESKDIENLNNNTVKNINESPKSDLKNLIVTDESLLNRGYGVTLFSIMSKTIEKLWQLKVRKDSENLSEYLIEFFNELVAIFPDELKLKIKENRNKNYINHQNMFIYYLTIAKEIQGRSNWKELLYDIVQNTNFDKENECWKGNVTYINSWNIDSKLPDIVSRYKKHIRSEINEK